SASTLLGEQHPVDHSLAVHTHFPDLAVEMARSPQASLANFRHPREHGRGITVAQPVDELCHRTTPRCSPVVAPAPPNGGGRLRLDARRWSAWAHDLPRLRDRRAR